MFSELSTVIYIYPCFPCFPSAERRLLCEVKKASLQHKQALFAVQGSFVLKAGEAGGGNPHVPRSRDRQANCPQARPPQCPESTFIPALYTYFSTITGDNCLLIISVLQYLSTLIHIQQAKHRFLFTTQYSQDMWVTPRQARLWQTAGTVCQSCEKDLYQHLYTHLINIFIHTCR